MKRIVLAISLLFVASPALADDAGPDPVVAADHGSAAGAATPDAAAPAPVALPDPSAAPAESAGLIWKLYKGGHLIPALTVLAFFLLFLLQKWIAWLRTGYRKLFVASALAGLGMLAERAANGETPNLMMIMGAFGAAMALYVKGGEAAPKA